MEKLNELIDFAISEERKAADLYDRTAAKVKDKATAEMLKDMANMERGHEQKLLSFKEGRVEKFEPKKVEDLKLSDYMVDVELKDDSPVQDVLVFAMKAEKAANELYSDLSTIYVDEDKKAFMLAMAQEELKHKNDLEKVYDDKIYQEN